GGLVTALCVSVLAGWAFGISWLASWNAGSRPMWPIAAVMLGTCGLALLIVRREPRGTFAVWFVRVSSVMVAVAAIAYLAEFATGADFGIDGLLFPTKVRAHEMMWPGRPFP